MYLDVAPTLSLASFSYKEVSKATTTQIDGSVGHLTPLNMIQRSIRTGTMAT